MHRTSFGLKELCVFCCDCQDSEAGSKECLCIYNAIWEHRCVFLTVTLNTHLIWTCKQSLVILLCFIFMFLYEIVFLYMNHEKYQTI